MLPSFDLLQKWVAWTRLFICVCVCVCICLGLCYSCFSLLVVIVDGDDRHWKRSFFSYSQCRVQS